MKKQINITKQQVERSVANTLGWTVARLHWFARTGREYVQLYGANALLGMKSK